MKPLLALTKAISNSKPGPKTIAHRRQLSVFALRLAAYAAFAIFALTSAQAAEQACPRPRSGATVQNPPELRSHDGRLEVTLHFKYEETMVGQGPPRYCYVTDDGLESPTLRVHPGDQLIIHFHNDLPPASPQTAAPSDAANDPDRDCHATAMNASVTNLHFHGMTMPPTCHQDDVVRTAIPGGDEFDYRVTIPRDEPPGLYWYHPHPHGYSERQVQGGASGALIVEGLQTVQPSLAGLPERVIVLRDQTLTQFRATSGQRPAWDISINYVPVTYPSFQPAIIETKPGQRELWRVLNAAADTLFNLQLMIAGAPQAVKVVAIDGVPVSGDPQTETTIPLPTGARVEFIAETPKPGEQAQLVTNAWNTGPEGDLDPSRPIATIISRDDSAGQTARPESPAATVANRWHQPNDPPAIVQRKLYFSQQTPNPLEGDISVFYFITVAGQTPAVYRMGQRPNIVVHQGDVEDWTVENRAPEDHVFHIHQIHFRVLAIDGKPVNDDALRDTIDVPYWSGSGPYPSVKLRMDFRDPNIVGTFMYHCHILKHEDMGMMGLIQVLPPGLPTLTRLQAPAGIGTATLVTVIAKVTAKDAAGASPTGRVQFTVDGVTTSRTMPVVNGAASFTTSFDTAGEHVIIAAYTGDARYDVSASAPLKLHVLN